MKPNLAFLLIFSLIFTHLLSWEYPVKDLKVTSLFGESRFDHFHNGIDFANVQLVYPIEDGELIFYREEDPLTPFMGIGNYMVIAHQNQIRSYYYHLADNSLEKNIDLVNGNKAIATMGDSGKSYGNHLHLTVVDSKNRRLINPQILLPDQEDKKKPIIESLFFTIKQKPNIFKIKNRSIFNYKNSIKLYLIAGDIKPYYPISRNLSLLNARGLRRVFFMVDGQVYKNYEFDYLLQRDSQLVLNNGDDFSATYGFPFNFLLGEFYPTKSKHLFYIEVEDWAGNRDVKEYNVIFRL